MTNHSLVTITRRGGSVKLLAKVLAVVKSYTYPKPQRMKTLWMNLLPTKLGKNHKEVYERKEQFEKLIWKTDCSSWIQRQET